jgi:hypothetical protein
MPGWALVEGNGSAAFGAKFTNQSSHADHLLVDGLVKKRSRGLAE